MKTSGRINPVIVNYCTPDLTLKCVESILRLGLADAADIVVVENASPDDSYARLSQQLQGVQLLRSTTNGGYGAGVNIGVGVCEREFVLVLNPDTYFEDQSLGAALELLDQQADVGIVGLDLIYPNGERQYSARRFYTVIDIVGRRLPIGRYWPLKTWIDRHMMIRAWDDGQAFRADWVMGTGFVIRRDLYARIGGMDESYFLYMEDVDLCARVWEAGYRVVCIPGVRLVHDHQRSSKAGPFSKAGRMHLQSLSRFRKKFRVPFLIAPKINELKR